MENISYKGFEGSAEVDMTTKVCRGKFLFIDDLITYQAATPAELQGEFEAAVDDYLKTCAALGREAQRLFRGLSRLLTAAVRTPAMPQRLLIMPWESKAT